MIVRMDDVGLHLAQKPNPASQAVGRGLVSSMPRVLTTLSIVGTAAMLWVGGGIVIHGLHELGWHLPGDLLDAAEATVARGSGVIGGVLGWLTQVAISAFVGLALGALIAFVMHRVLGLGHDSH